MAKNMDRRVRKTRAQLRQGLAELLKEKSIKEITVKELVEKVDINRSTFYLHYTDIYDMMEKIENELTGEIEDLIHTHPVSPFNEDSFPFIEDIYAFCLSGCIGLVKTWLSEGSSVSPQHMAELTFKLIMNALRGFYPDLSVKHHDF